MRIAVLGTGMMAEALGMRWAAAGHEIVVAGRSPDRSAALASRLVGSATAASPRDAVRGADVVLLAVPWGGVEETLRRAGADEGAFADITVIDPTNAVEHGVGVLLTEPGTSGAQRIGALAPGARVVKAFHMVPASHWQGTDIEPTTVVLCGDDTASLRMVEELVQDAGAQPAVLGSLARARQLEEAAGFVIGLVFSGVDPRTAVPALS